MSSLFSYIAKDAAMESKAKPTQIFAKGNRYQLFALYYSTIYS